MSVGAIASYLKEIEQRDLSIGFLAYLCNLTKVAEISPEVAAAIVRELADQRSHLKLIASENYCSLSTQLAMGNLLTDKYAEGFPQHRFYAGCDNIDTIEARACEEACQLFGCDHAYVQPHSGADANLVAYWAILQTRVGSKLMKDLNKEKLTDLTGEQWSEFRRALGNQRLLGMDYYSGGHLTHGYRYNVSAQMFDAHSYSVSKKNGLIDYDEIEATAKRVKPLILLAGYSAYPRSINFKHLREIADRIGAVLMVDMAHFAGLVAGKVFRDSENPVAHAHVVTTTTHKTLRGPRGGLVLCTEEFSEQVDKGCPLVLGGPLPHVIAAKAICLMEARSPQFCEYAQAVVRNARALAHACIEEGLEVVTGGTDNHLLLIDVRPFGITGRQAEGSVRECGVTLNRNSLPFDSNGPWFTSGLRLGTPAVTTLGMGEKEMSEIASVMKTILKGTQAAEISSGKDKGQISKSKYLLEDSVRLEAKARVHALLKGFPVYPELDLGFLMEHFVAPLNGGRTHSA